MLIHFLIPIQLTQNWLGGEGKKIILDLSRPRPLNKGIVIEMDGLDIRLPNDLSMTRLTKQLISKS